MDISLDEAIHIHARALKGRAGGNSPMLARLRAGDLRDKGDLEDFGVARGSANRPNCCSRRSRAPSGKRKTAADAGRGLG